MKTERLNFQWFEREDRRKPLRASLGRDCKLRLGEELRKKVPQTIRIGFDTKNRILAIADGHGNGITWPKSGNLNAKALCNEVYSAGIKLPVIFDFERDPETGFYLGKILLNLEPESADVDQLLTLYQPAINMIIHRAYRSMPAAERRAYAIEAFCKGCFQSTLYHTFGYIFRNNSQTFFDKHTNLIQFLIHVSIIDGNRCQIAI